MADNSKIEWTEATWNPVTGCTQVSPGCAHCYAKTFAERWRGIPGHPYEQGFELRSWRRTTGPTAALASTSPDLRQLDERPFPRRDPIRVHPSGVRRDGAGRAPHVSSPDQAGSTARRTRHQICRGQRMSGQESASKTDALSSARNFCAKSQPPSDSCPQSLYWGPSQSQPDRHRLAHRRWRVWSGSPGG